MDINALFTDGGLRAFTDAQRDQHMEDARQYGQLADIIKARLQQTSVDGDRWLSARLRARRVARQVRAMEKASKAAASSAEALYATYVNQVLELPQRRELAAARKAQRKQQRSVSAGEFVAKSLETSATQLIGTVPETALPQAGGGAQYLPPQPFPFPMAAGSEGQPTRTISDFFPREGGR
jgi:hypothetical protein